MADTSQAFKLHTDEDGLLTIEQFSGPKLTRSEAIAICRDIAACEGVPLVAVRLRTDYTLLADQVTVSGYIPSTPEQAAALDDVVAAAVRRIDRGV